MTRHITTFLVDKEGDSPDGKLRMRVRWGKDNRVAVNLGYRITLSKWSKESQRAKVNTTHGKKKVPASVINAEISRYEQVVEDTFRHFDEEPSVEEFRSELRLRLGRDNDVSAPLVRIVYGEYLARQSASGDWTDSSLDTYRTYLTMFRSYDHDLRLDQLGKGGMEKLYKHLLDSGLKNRTVALYLDKAKMFLRWAQKNGYPVDPSFDEFRPKIKVVPKTIVWLTWDELLMLYNAPKEGWKKGECTAADYFLLACFTGLRWSDLESLKWSEVGDKIRIVTKKTGAPLVIELNHFSREIIDRHRSDTPKTGYVLPRLSQSSVNIKIKKIAKSVGITSEETIVYFKKAQRIEETKQKCEFLSMHCGRRTFICNAISKGINPLTIMKWTGHKGYESMKPYVDIASQEKERAMSLFDQ